MPRTILTLVSGDWRGTGSATCDQLTLFDSVGFESEDSTRHESGFRTVLLSAPRHDQ